MTLRASTLEAPADTGIRVPVQLAFNATGRAASLGGIVRAIVVIGASVALGAAILTGLGGKAKAAEFMGRMSDRVAWSLSLSYARHLAARVDTSCLPASIKSALATTNAACGIRVISTRRPGARIAGTSHASMHATCRAADFTSDNYRCVYAALAGWQGKLSTDALRVKHVHIDNGRYARFAHGGSRRYAKHHKRRLARRHGRRA